MEKILSEEIKLSCDLKARKRPACWEPELWFSGRKLVQCFQVETSMAILKTESSPLLLSLKRGRRWVDHTSCQALETGQGEGFGLKKKKSEGFSNALQVITTPLAIWRKDCRKVRAHPSLQWFMGIFYTAHFNHFNYQCHTSGVRGSLFSPISPWCLDKHFPKKTSLLVDFPLQWGTVENLQEYLALPSAPSLSICASLGKFLSFSGSQIPF